MDVVVLARELGVLVNGEEDVGIAVRTAVEPSFPFPRHAQPGAVVDTGRDFHGDRLLLAHAAGAVAARAWILDHFPGAAALRAGPGHGEESLGVAHLSAAAATGAGDRLRA